MRPSVAIDRGGLRQPGDLLRTTITRFRRSSTSSRSATTTRPTARSCRPIRSPNLLNSVHDDENVYARTASTKFGYGPLGVITGVRVENTRATYSAYKQDATGLTCPVGQDCPVSTKPQLHQLLPDSSGPVRDLARPDRPPGGLLDPRTSGL